VRREADRVEEVGVLRTFVHGERGKMGTLPGKHDDRVMALASANIAAPETSASGDSVFF
jgi:hypothetical protein